MDRKEAFETRLSYKGHGLRLIKPRSAPPYRCGTLTHDNMDTALLGAVRGLDWSGDLRFTKGGTAIIEGDKPDLEPNKGDSG